MHREFPNVTLMPIRYSNGFKRSLTQASGQSSHTESMPMSHESSPPLYPLTDFFRNPDRGFFRLSDDGRWLSFMEPVSFDDAPARMNIFVQALEGSEPKIGRAHV